MVLNTRTEQILAVALAVTIIVAASLLIVTYKIHNKGRIVAIGVEVFWDQNCTNKCTEIDWGNLRPGDIATVTIYIKNSRQIPETLSFNTSAWQPASIADYLTLDWNYDDQILLAGQNVEVVLQLQVNIGIPDGYSNFSFDITIIGTEVS